MIRVIRLNSSEKLDLQFYFVRNLLTIFVFCSFFFFCFPPKGRVNSNESSCDEMSKSFEISMTDQYSWPTAESTKFGADELLVTTQQTNASENIESTSSKKLYNCDFCPNVYTAKFSLDRHIKDKHVEEFPFHCSKCRKSFSSEAKANEHTVHCGYMKPKCDFCEYSNSDSSKVRKHMAKHTGEKIFQCKFPKCSRVYKQKFSLQRHMKDAHDDNTEKLVLAADNENLTKVLESVENISSA